MYFEEKKNRRKQALLDFAKLQGFREEEMRILEEKLENAKNIHDGIEEFRNFKKAKVEEK